MKENVAYNIQTAVEEIFKGKFSVDQAKNFINEKIENHRNLRPAIYNELQNILQVYQKEVDKKGKRVSAFLDREEKYQIKIAESIIEKIWRSKQDYKEHREKKIKYTIDNFHKTMGDILRFRILCNYLCDIFAVKEVLLKEMKERDYLMHDEYPKDFVNLMPGERKEGHRAVHFVFKKKIMNQAYLFEVQLMTLLQHAWNRKAHHLVYAYTRNGENVPLDITMRSYAMSEMLYIADDFFNEMFIKSRNTLGGS